MSISKVASKKYGHKYRVRVTNPAGKQITLGNYRLKSEAQKAERDYQDQYNGATHAENLARFNALERAKVTTFGELAQRYLEIRELKAKTKEHYETYLAKYLQAFTDKLIRLITQEDIEDWSKSWGDRAPYQRQRVYQFLHAVMNYAVELDYINRNPCRIPRGFAKLEPAREKQIPTEEQVRQIIALTEYPSERLAYIIAFNAGLRVGEIAELRRKDLTLNKEEGRFILNCSRGVTWLRNGEIKVTTRKNQKTNVVKLSRELTDEIKSLLNNLGTFDQEALIHPANRTPETHFSYHQLNRRWDKLRKQVGYTGVFHDSRRFVNSWLYAIGATPKEAMDRLGQTTFQANQVYQLGLGRDGELADKLPSLK